MAFELYLCNTEPKNYRTRSAPPSGLTAVQLRQYAGMVGADVSSVEKDSDGEVSKLREAIEKPFEVPWEGGPQVMVIRIPEKYDGKPYPLTMALKGIDHVWNGQAGMAPPQAGAPALWVSANDPGLAAAVKSLVGDENTEILDFEEGKRRYELKDYMGGTTDEA